MDIANTLIKFSTNVLSEVDYRYYTVFQYGLVLLAQGFCHVFDSECLALDCNTRLPISSNISDAHLIW